jgi:K(+)-stimulated pyrophosphate-energized sodium pump
LGTIVPFLFTSLTLNAVGRAASRMIDEVRRQFREIPGLRSGAESATPNYGACVEIATAGSLREMVLPGTLAVAAPLIVGFIDVEALAGFLAGSLACGFLLATFMVNAGGAWDSAKRLIEAGAFGGRGSQAHEAVVVGDGVGDSFKDTSGPALNVLVKLMTIVALVFSTAFVG